MRIALGILGVVVFLAISALLARWLTTDNAERDQVKRLLQAQARGDAGGMLHELGPCDPGCVSQARANARRLRRPGSVQIVSFDSATAHALSSRTGVTRVVWKTPQTLTVVQCVRVQRAGNALKGLTVHLLDVSAPNRRTADC